MGHHAVEVRIGILLRRMATRGGRTGHPSGSDKQVGGEGEPTIRLQSWSQTEFRIAKILYI